MSTVADNVLALENFQSILVGTGCGIGAIFMQLGFTLLESGRAKSTNALNVMLKNMVDCAISVLAVFLIGYALAYGEDTANGLIGVPEWSSVDDSVLTDIILHASFTTNCATIFGGSVAGRTKMTSYAILAFTVAAIIYPLAVHWIWHPKGWLHDLGSNGLLDFSGSGPVHLVGGTVGLVGATVVGARLEVFKDGKFHAQPPHNSVVMGLGALMLWIAWFFFNSAAAKSMSIGDQARVIPLTVLNTLVSGASASLLSYIWRRISDQSYSVGHFSNALLGGLVSITAPCSFVDPWVAIVIGLVSVPVLLATTKLLIRFEIDDPLDAVAVHTGCGIWGLTSVGLFARRHRIEDYISRETNAYGLFYGGGWEQLGIQLFGCAVLFAWTAIVTWIAAKILQRQGLLRISRETEIGGVDLFKHDVTAYPEFTLLLSGGGRPLTGASGGVIIDPHDVTDDRPVSRQEFLEVMRRRGRASPAAPPAGSSSSGSGRHERHERHERHDRYERHEPDSKFGVEMRSSGPPLEAGIYDRPGSDSVTERGSHSTSSHRIVFTDGVVNPTAEMVGPRPVVDNPDVILGFGECDVPSESDEHTTDTDRRRNSSGGPIAGARMSAMS